MDLFNSKKIKEIKEELANLQIKVDNIDRNKQPRYYSTDGCYPEDTELIGLIGRHLRAIEDYLGIKINCEYIDDPYYIKSETPRIRVWRAHKKEKK